MQQKLTITILSGSGDFLDALVATKEWVQSGSRMWRWENDTDSYEWAITHIYDK